MSPWACGQEFLACVPREGDLGERHLSRLARNGPAAFHGGCECSPPPLAPVHPCQTVGAWGGGALAAPLSWLHLVLSHLNVFQPTGCEMPSHCGFTLHSSDY